MSITQQHKVEFTVTSVLPSDVQKQLVEDIESALNSIREGKDTHNGRKIDHRTKHMLSIYSAEGIEGVANFLVRGAMREAIKELHEEFADGEQFRFSPAKVQKVSQ